MEDYDSIIIFSQTAEFNKEYDIFKENHSNLNIFSTVTNQDLETINEEKANDSDNPTLIIFDDVIGIGGKKSFLHSASEFSRMVTSARHFNISMIVSLQKYKSAPPILRQNSENVIIFKLISKEYGDMYSEIGADVAPSKKIFVSTVNKVTNKQGMAVEYEFWDDQSFKPLKIPNFNPNDDSIITTGNRLFSAKSNVEDMNDENNLKKSLLNI
tara:strand:- start:712 stop:1350 length:639 start_codon:yes stop_codon:yes gene_type:complete